MLSYFITSKDGGDESHDRFLLQRHQLDIC
uniref:Uncharacterized protein n=1 Tax=Rhizophora mucronata TaxID=61149 RepID=A0A2P2QUK0_RHIMU